MAGLLELFRPDGYVARVMDIDLARLAAAGCDCLLLDLDNTLLPWKSSEVSEEVKAWVARAKELGIRPAIVSNTHYHTRLRKIAEALDIPWTAHAMKPWRKGFVEAARLVGSGPEKAVVVGDQLLTDVLGGNRAGMRTILVKPVHHHEFIGTKLSRLVERGIMSVMGLRVGQGTKWEAIQSQTRDTR